MKISFFEEFPSERSLQKANLLSFQTDIFLAATDLVDFDSKVRLAKRIIKKPGKMHIWPVLSDKEGYWLSPFSDQKAIGRIIDLLDGYDGRFLWDGELPMLSKGLFIKNLMSFFRTRSMIRKFMSKRSGDAVVAEISGMSRLIKIFLGISFRNCTTTVMAYQSFMPKRLRRSFLKRILRKNPKVIGLGVITTGILGDEKIIGPDELKDAIIACGKAGVREVIIFRLGGLNKEYAGAIEDARRAFQDQ